MSAIGRVVRAGVGRRRVQTMVMLLTTMFTVASSILAAGLLVASYAPFDHAFAKQNGAHLSAQFDGSKASVAQITNTKNADGVTAAAGPFLTATAQPKLASGDNGLPAGMPLPQMTMVGRADDDGPVDDVTLVHGHWPTSAGEIALDTNYFEANVGAKLKFADLPGTPTLTVVGIVRSVSETADAWVTPAEAATLSAETSPTYEMLYRFAHAATTAQINADRAALSTASPSGSIVGTQSYLSIKQVQTTNTGAFVPFIAAFGVIGLVMSVLIISTVVSGSVGSATWRIGVLKSLGLTPAQVVRAYVAQAWIPAAVGTLLGIVVGNLLAIPVLNGADNTYGGAGLSIPLWVNVAVPLLALVLVACAAFVPALRAGRMRAAETIAVGRTPRAGRPRNVQRWAARLQLPRPVTLGLATPFGRPARSGALAAAVVFGTASVAFATGLALSLNGVQHGRSLDSAGAVTINTAAFPDISGKSITVRPGQDGTRTPADPAAVAGIIKSQPGTKSYYGTIGAQVQVNGISGLSEAVAYTGDSSWATHQMISGRWLSGPGEAVASPRFVTAAGLHVGDMVTVSNAGKSTSVRIVGSEFELSHDGMDLLTDASTFSALGIAETGMQYQVELQHGTSVTQYLDAINQQLRPMNADAEPVFRDRSSVIAAMDALVALLSIMMVVVAALGVLNTVVLETRERVHDLGVLKALGMSPRQTITTVITSAATVGVVGGLIGVPVGIAVHAYVLPIMGHIAGTTLPKADLDVYSLASIVALGLGGVAIAVVGALLPASWAAKIRTASALRTE